ncbi:FAD-binding oxidoreductase [Halobacillus sp. A5]|uniref:NAD(P)/FAD-dependent oxidoreductase n=1 Tax=Halobacillus sp. A5 TaxID=2880263 RepID=UPI0020A65575|nr:FAD-dependent oxidoreductase [Halobacillus sp. A5]MCP3028444.1 FAD-binding oxidoreductase [Halobacillus sp. A5]
MQKQSDSLWRDHVIESFPALKKDTSTCVTRDHFSARLIYSQLIKTIGLSEARQYYHANEDGLKLIDQIRKDLKMDCDFSSKDAFVYGVSSPAKREIYKEAEEYERIGINGGLCYIEELPFSVTAAITMRGQAQFHPVKYLAGLIRELKALGTPIYENSRAVQVEKGARPLVITREGHSITCDHVIMATHYPFQDFDSFYFSRLHVERSYSIAAQAEGPIPDVMSLINGLHRI